MKSSAEPGSHVDGSGLAVVVGVQRNLVVRFVIEEPPKCELEEAVMPRFAVDELIAKRIVGVAGAVTQLVGIDGVEVGCVGRVDDFRLEGRLLTTQFLRPIDLVEERVVFNLFDVLADALVLALAQPLDDIGRLWRKLCLRWNSQGLPPMNHLRVEKGFE